jgi:hypothetical protein
MVNAIGRQQRPDVRAALAEIAPQWKRILWFSLKFLIAFLVVTAAISYPPIKLSNAAHHPEIAASMFFIPIEVLLVIGCVSWLLIPAAIRLLQAPEVGPITAEDRRRGTIFAILAVAVATALGELFQRAESVMTFTSHTESTVAYLVTALLVNAPDVLLFIALSLLALKDACNNSIQGCNEAVDLPSE